MKTWLKRIGIGIGLLLASLTLIAFVVIAGLPIDRWIGLLETHAAARSGLEIRNDGWEKNGLLGLQTENLRLIKDDKTAASFTKANVGLDTVKLFTGAAIGTVDLVDRTGGTLEVNVGRNLNETLIDVIAKEFDLSPINAGLATYGASITAALSASIELTASNELPGALYGDVDLKIPSLDVDGGPLLQSFGLSTIGFDAIKGKGTFEHGKMNDFSGTIDGEEIFGTFRAEVRIDPQAKGGNWTAIPKIKFSEGILGDIGTMLPLTGLVRDAQKNYSRRYNGRW